ncbi:rho guanine nucleotide exchange factor 26 isoform X2 [Folsomia candida]|uniref:rho guanine nucleotide exchange factor 26 isoform X2 n=1 Tax=Folsomia candida TaxID=158441 RepID=UPI000B8EF85F|nr:rho guanine nucleotide exchange factor 26 isoform X2 [Folsomia candida]
MVDILASGSTLIQVCDDPLEFLEQGGYRRRHNFECFDDGKHSYYSDVGGGKSDSTEGGDASIKNLYLRFRFICSNIVDGKWKPEEEQEISVFVKEFGYEDDLDKPLPHPPSSTYASPNSSDSFYSEPIYGITNQITHFTSGTKNPGPPVPDTLRRPSLVPNPSHQNVISCNNVIRNEPSITPQPAFHNKLPSVGENSLIYADSSPTATQILLRADKEDVFQPNDKLPPIPPSKLSTMAKSAGKKLAKKFMGIRKTSKCSMEHFEQSSSSCSSNAGSALGGQLTPTYGPINSEVTAKPVQVYGSSAPRMVQTPSSNDKSPSGGGQPNPLRRPISRPSIPPPEPPKSIYGGSSNGSSNGTQNYSIYDKSDGVNRRTEDDDDFDDSDFYDSDSELIRNFVSQVQPIYSMEEEPLYQYYAYGISIKPDDDYQPVIPKNLGLTLDMLVPRVGQRTLWCELSEVIASGILSILSDKQKQLQEAVFEILTSEVSYLKSLDVLIAVFYQNEELIGVLNEEERSYLFGNIEQVRECAHSFLAELLAKWDESWYIQEIGEIIDRNTNSRFSVYKEYCRNKPHQDKTMQRLRHSRDEFVNVIKTLEEDTRCQMLRMDSFLMLPMQRITRLPLLVNAVIQRTTSVKEKTNCEKALKSLTNLVLDCNEAARESQDAEETSAILDKLDFSRVAPTKPLTSFGQFVMKGDFQKNPFDQGRGGNQINWTFRKNKRTMYWLLLFTNQLLVTKKKTNGKFEVLDSFTPEESNLKPLPNLGELGVANDFQNFFMLHFDNKETVYFLAARTNSEIERWKAKLDSSKKAVKKLRVESIFPYDARRADELSFGVGDVIEVGQMQPDGWYYGTKVIGGQMGWFPSNYSAEL